MITWTINHIKSHLTKLNKIKLAVIQRFDFSLLRVIVQFINLNSLYFQNFPSFQNLVYEDASIILNCTYSRLSEKCIIYFFWKHSVASRNPLSFYGVWSNGNFILNLSDLKQYNRLTCFYFATCFTPLLSKISSMSNKFLSFRVFRQLSSSSLSHSPHFSR